MNRWQNVSSKKPFAPVNERCSPRSSSDRCSSKYSTCSDYEIRDVKNDALENLRGCEDIARTMGKPQNLSQLIRQNTLNSTEDTLDDTCYSVDILDRNLDVLTDDDAYTDCEDASLLKLDQLAISDYDRPDSDYESTVYVPPPLSRIGNINADNFYKLTSSKINSKPVISQDKSRSMYSTGYENNQDRLVTICEVTEHTQNSNSLSCNTTVFSKNVSKKYSADTDEIHFDVELTDYNKNIPKKVTKLPSIAKLKELKEISQRKQDDLRKNIQITNKNHNTTESFIQWEKFFKATEYLDSRKSKSFTDLSTESDDYCGDAESTDEYLDPSMTLNETSMVEKMCQKKHIRYRTKSCDSLLEDVRHLPHVFYEKYNEFLESLSKEIEIIRSQTVVCTCNKRCVQKVPMQNHSNLLRPSSARPSARTCNEIAYTSDTASKTKISVSVKSPTYNDFFLLESDAHSTVSSLQNHTSESKTSPKLLKVPSPVHGASNSHCSPKTPTSPFTKRGLYPWEKEVVSPVGEYIKGKRPSPFQKSPIKRL